MTRKITVKFGLILLLTSSCLCQAQDMQDKDPCAEAETTVEMRECLNQRFQNADTALNEVYQKLGSKLNESRREKLRDVQRAWIVFRNKNAEFAASKEEGGSLAPLTRMLVMAEMTEERVAELKEILHSLDSQ